MTREEERIADRYATLLDYVGRCRAAIEGGNWHYLWEKAADVRRSADQLAEALTRPGRSADGAQIQGYHEPAADPTAVLAHVRTLGGGYPAVRLLHPAPAITVHLDVPGAVPGVPR